MKWKVFVESTYLLSQTTYSRTSQSLYADVYTLRLYQKDPECSSSQI